MWSKVLVYGMGFRLDVEFNETIESDKSYMFCPNHGSLMDPFVLILLSKKYSFIELMQCPVQGQLWNKSRAINIAVRHCDTDYVLVSDIDMIFSPKFIDIVFNFKLESEIVYFQVGYLSKEESKLNKEFSTYVIKHKSTIYATGITLFPKNVLTKKVNMLFPKRSNQFASSLIEFFPNLEASKAFKNKFGLQGVPYILFMGRLNLIKGPDILLKAYIRLSLEFPTLHLVFAGPDEGLGDQLRKKIKEESLENRIHLIGYIEGYDKVGAYTGAEFLVVPSRREAMSIVALEAGACGTPVILSTECGFDEVKEVGCKVVQPIADELYNGMNSMLSSSKSLKALGNDLRNLILERYTWKKSAEQYLKLLP